MEETKIHSTHLLGIPVEVSEKAFVPIGENIDSFEDSIKAIRGIVRSVGQHFIHLECRYAYHQDHACQYSEWYWRKLEPPSIKVINIHVFDVGVLSMATERDVGSMEMECILRSSTDDVMWLNPLTEVPEIEIRRTSEGKLFPALKLCNGTVEVEVDSQWWPISVIDDLALDITLHDDEQSARSSAQKYIQKRWSHVASL